jgi:hypothetical protein
MGMFENQSALAEIMEKELAKVECKLEDGSTVTNYEGICQGFIGRALNGDLGAAEFIVKLTGKNGGKK